MQNEPFKLDEVLATIDVLFAAGKLTEEQRDELITIAREKADPVAESGIEARLVEMANQIHELEQRIVALEIGGSNSEIGSTAEPYVDGKWYYNGDKIVWTDGETYMCVAPEGQVCVWSPEAYPAYWQKLLA